MTQPGNKEIPPEHLMDFWGHLDVLRNMLLRVIVVALLCAIVCFAFKAPLFDLLLAPAHDSFITYRLMRITVSLTGGNMEFFSVPLINTGLAGQFVMHMRAAMCMGVVLASPYILFEFFRFVAPGLYTKEKRVLIRLAGAAIVMFLLGAVVNYLLLFPLTFRFLGTYQVNAAIGNLITLESYMSTLFGMTLMMGLAFELPVLCCLLAKIGVLDDKWLRKRRRYAVVLLLTTAAIITPTGDPFTLTVVFLPLYLLYEIGILLVRLVGKKS